ATQGLFTLESGGRFANNRLSAWLRSDAQPSMRDFVEYFASEANVRAWLDIDRTLQTGETAFPRVDGKAVWADFEGPPCERDVVAGSMSASTQMEAPAVAKGYPFSEVRRLCDVGGGRGLLLSEILVHHPHLQGVLYDAQGVVDGAARLFETRGVASR